MKRGKELYGSVVKVGSGRGFVVEGDRNERYVITAAHCLPHLPPAHPWSYPHERTYDKLIGPLASGTPDVWVECLFADPVADLAILGDPDGQELSKEWEAFNSFIEKTTPLPISGTQIIRGYVLTLAEPFKWIEVSLTTHPRSVSITEGVESGMSGSPILDAEWRAVAIISTDSINPRLGTCLPGWAIEGPLEAAVANFLVSLKPLPIAFIVPAHPFWFRGKTPFIGMEITNQSRSDLGLPKLCPFFKG